MNFADVAEQVLEKASGGPLRYGEITQRAIDDGLISPKSDQPWVYMASAINADTRTRIARGDRPRFTSPRRGSVQLTAPSSAPEDAVKAWNKQSKDKLLERLYETTPTRFEQIVGELLSLIGFEDIEVTARSRDGGIDVRGTLTVGGITQVATAIEVKRWKNKIGGPVVRGLRGGLGPKEQGLIVTLSDFTSDAVREAEISDRAPITLINGQRLVDLMAEHGLGLRRRDLRVLELMENAFVEAADDDDQDEDELDDVDSHEEDSSAVSVAESPRPPTAVRSNRALFRLPGRPSNYLNALSVLLECTSKQPTFDEFLDSFQKTFPEITLRVEAKRRASVLLALDFSRIEGDRIALTPAGNAFLTSRDPKLVKDAIIARIPGAAEIETSLKAGKERDEIYKGLKSEGSALTLTQFVSICKWLSVTR